MKNYALANAKCLEAVKKAKRKENKENIGKPMYGISRKEIMNMYLHYLQK